jgi:hypothetical protein
MILVGIKSSSVKLREGGTARFPGREFAGHRPWPQPGGGRGGKDLQQGAAGSTPRLGQEAHHCPRPVCTGVLGQQLSTGAHPRGPSDATPKSGRAAIRANSRRRTPIVTRSVPCASAKPIWRARPGTTRRKSGDTTPARANFFSMRAANFSDNRDTAKIVLYAAADNKLLMSSASVLTSANSQVER